MSVPGLNGIAPGVAAPIRPAPSAAPVPTAPPEDKAAQTALNDLVNGAAPSDASIGLYASVLDAPAAIIAERAALAADVQAHNIVQQDVVQQDLAANALACAALSADLLQQQTEAAIVRQNQAALAEIENSLNAALVEAKRTAFAADLEDLLQAVEAGASELAVAFADKLQATRQGGGGFNLAAIPASPPPTETAAALPALVENLIAMTQAGDMPAAAVFAQAIRMRMDEAPAALPPGWLAALAAASAGAVAPPPDVGADPLLQAYQASLIVDVKTTLNKLRKLREDRLNVLPILALEENEIYEHGRKDR